MSISLKPSEMSVGGGLWGDMDATITGARFIMSNFGGKAVSEVPVFELTVADAAGEEYEQLLSTGKGGTPSEDGESLEGSGKLNSGSNFGLFLSSMVSGGFPENRLEDKASALVGTKAHFERVAAPKRAGLVKAPRADGKVYEDMILIVTKVLELPGAKAKAKAPAKVTGKAPAAAKAKAPAGDTSEISDMALGAFMQVLSENPEGLTKQQLAAKAFAVVSANPSKTEIVKMAYDEEFMASGPWSITEGIITM